MVRIDPLIHCVNPTCSDPLNLLDREYCETCHTKLIYRYLWASGHQAAEIPPGELVGGRYYVIKPHIWLDTRPNLLPYAPEELPNDIIAYLKLYHKQLHIPEVYGYVHLASDKDTMEDWDDNLDQEEDYELSNVETQENTKIILLENIPLDSNGQLYPSMLEAWRTATDIRRIYWLWQLLDLWNELSDLGVAASLFISDNVRVDGWRIRLIELLNPRELSHLNNITDLSEPTIKELADYWLELAQELSSPLKEELQQICHQIEQDYLKWGDSREFKTYPHRAQLNELLLKKAAELPLRLRIAGATDQGKIREHNEDACYPTMDDKNSETGVTDLLIPYLAIICDGIGGHEGGEVASNLAIESLKLQVRALLMEVAQQTEIMTPELVEEHIKAIIRVANNLISVRNDQQRKSAKERMGTTVVMALQLPQMVNSPQGLKNSHELYIAHVGDSRAYWITADSCQKLTIDHDVAVREVQLGRGLYRISQARSDAQALTQALGTKDGDWIKPSVSRFIIEEDGVLLLCSDGICDYDWVEQSWLNYIPAILSGDRSVEEITDLWLHDTNQQLGHDNLSLTLTYCRVTPEYSVVFTPNTTEPPASPFIPVPIEPEIMAIAPDEMELEPIKIPEPFIYQPEPPSSDIRQSNSNEQLESAAYNQSLANDDNNNEEEEEEIVTSNRPTLSLILGIIVLFCGIITASLVAWSVLDSKGFKQTCEQLPDPIKPICTPFLPKT